MSEVKRYKFTDVSSFRGAWPDVCDFVDAAEYDAIRAEVERLTAENERINDELSACTESPGTCGYWREAARLRGVERDDLRAALQRQHESHRTTFTQLEQAKRELAQLKGIGSHINGFEDYAQRRFPIADRRGSLGAHSREHKKTASEAWEACAQYLARARTRISPQNSQPADEGQHE